MKKGNLPIEYIAGFILALAVLVFMIFYFSGIRESIVDTVKQFFEAYL